MGFYTDQLAAEPPLLPTEPPPAYTVLSWYGQESVRIAMPDGGQYMVEVIHRELTLETPHVRTSYTQLDDSAAWLFMPRGHGVGARTALVHYFAGLANVPRPVLPMHDRLDVRRYGQVRVPSPEYSPFGLTRDTYVGHTHLLYNYAGLNTLWVPFRHWSEAKTRPHLARALAAFFADPWTDQDLD